MEDALAQLQAKVSLHVLKVLILVLMEDALAQVGRNGYYPGQSLNPCFNGRCTRTHSFGSYA